MLWKFILSWFSWISPVNSLNNSTTQLPGTSRVLLPSTTLLPGTSRVLLPSTTLLPGTSRVLLPSTTQLPGTSRVLLLPATQLPGTSMVLLLFSACSDVFTEKRVQRKAMEISQTFEGCSVYIWSALRTGDWVSEKYQYAAISDMFSSFPLMFPYVSHSDSHVFSALPMFPYVSYIPYVKNFANLIGKYLCRVWYDNIKVLFYAFSLHPSRKRGRCTQLFSCTFSRIVKKTFLFEPSWASTSDYVFDTFKLNKDMKVRFLCTFFTEKQNKVRKPSGSKTGKS